MYLDCALRFEHLSSVRYIVGICTHIMYYNTHNVGKEENPVIINVLVLRLKYVVRSWPYDCRR